MPVCRLGGAVFAVAYVAIATAASGQDVAHYVSVDDLDLHDQGWVIPIYEYVDVALGPDGRGTIEVGFQHYGSSTITMLEHLAMEMLVGPASGFDPADLGRLDPANVRRVVMTGTVHVEPERLSWSVEMLAPLATEPFRTGSGEEPRISPFWVEAPEAGIRRIGGNAADLGEGFSLAVDGDLHRYVRRDPRLLPLASFLSRTNGLSIVESRACILPIAQTYLDGGTYTFSGEAVAALEVEMADEPGLALLQERGYGAALTLFLDGALAARAALNGWIDGEVKRLGLAFVLPAMEFASASLSDEQLEWSRQVTAASILIEQMHILPGDPNYPDGDLSSQIPSHMLVLMNEQVDQYNADPWSMTGPRTNAFVGRGWVSLLSRLLALECAG